MKDEALLESIVTLEIGCDDAAAEGDWQMMVSGTAHLGKEYRMFQEAAARLLWCGEYNNLRGIACVSRLAGEIEKALAIELYAERLARALKLNDLEEAEEIRDAFEFDGVPSLRILLEREAAQ